MAKHRRTIMIVRILVVFVVLAASVIFSVTTVAESVFGHHVTEKETCQSLQTDECRSVTVSQDTEINLIFTLVNVVSNQNLQKQFEKAVQSLLEHTTTPLVIHIIGETSSQKFANDVITAANKDLGRKLKITPLELDEIKQKLQDKLKPMQKHFSNKPGSYYSHELFFLSIMLHSVLPDSLKKVIMLDADLKFKADIKDLYNRFDLFTDSNVIGIGRELQPVYRHVLWEYRKENPGTRVGEAPPEGLTGFNSGVLLLNLERMRSSQLYNDMINAQSVEQLTDKYHFKGHLGDQDFFTVLSFEHGELFHVLPCGWNRQLCQWWRDKGYQAVFASYYNCDAPVSIYHGNCNTPIPDD